VTRTRAEFGLGKSRKDRRNLPPSGESANKRASTPRPKPPPALLVPDPLEEPAEEGAAGPAGRGVIPPLGALPVRDLSRPSPRPPERPPEASRASVSAQNRCAAAAFADAIAMSAPSPAATAGGPRTPWAPGAPGATLAGTARASGCSHAAVFVGAPSPRSASPCSAPGMPTVARPSAPRGAPDPDTGVGADVPVAGTTAGIAPVSGVDVGSGAPGTGAPSAGSGA
jgi:hypothetical protein